MTFSALRSALVVAGLAIAPFLTQAQCYQVSTSYSFTLVDFVAVDNCGTHHVKTVNLQTAPNACPAPPGRCAGVQAVGVITGQGTITVPLVAGQSVYYLPYSATPGEGLIDSCMRIEAL